MGGFKAFVPFRMVLCSLLCVRTARARRAVAIMFVDDRTTDVQFCRLVNGTVREGRVRQSHCLFGA